MNIALCLKVSHMCPLTSCIIRVHGLGKTQSGQNQRQPLKEVCAAVMKRRFMKPLHGVVPGGSLVGEGSGHPPELDFTPPLTAGVSTHRLTLWSKQGKGGGDFSSLLRNIPTEQSSGQPGGKRLRVTHSSHLFHVTYRTVQGKAFIAQESSAVHNQKKKSVSSCK